MSQRIATLYRLPGVKRGVLVVPIATLMQRIAPRSHVTGAGLVLDKGQKFDIATEQRRHGSGRLSARAAGHRAG